MQQRFHDYNRPLVSFDENQRILGLLWPGRICGFDTPIWNTNTISLTHGLTGIVETTIDQNLTLPKGVFVTRQGVVIKEDGTIGPLAISSNAGNAYKRVDTIVAEHEIVNSAGGAAAIYSIIQGPDGDENPASLTAPEKQIVIGYVTMQPSTATTSGATFKAVEPYHPGGLLTAFLNRENIFQELQQFAAGDTNRVTLSDGSTDWTGYTAISKNTLVNKTQSGVPNEISFLPKTQKGTFLIINNKAGTNLNLLHTANDALGTELPAVLWKDYSAIQNLNEVNTLLAAGGWALLLCTEDTGYTVYTILVTSKEVLDMANFQASISSLTSAVNGKVSITTESWRLVGASGNPAFGANFSSIPGLQFKKDNNNTVWIRGSVTWGTGGSNTVVFTLPAGYRPSLEQSYAGGVFEEHVMVTIKTNGNVELFSPLGGVSSGSFYITGCFRID